MTEAVKPFLKWVGGKRQLLGELLPHIQALGFPDGAWKGRYFEPFIGGGAVLFALANTPGFSAVANDYNAELINLYRTVRTQPDALVTRLREEEFANTAQAHQSVRAWDREETWSSRSSLDRAARFIYLNRTSFNGMWRVNSKGFFNVPFGRYENPGIPSAEVFAAASEALATTDLRQGDFEDAVADAKAGDVVYFDPPYIPVSLSSSFTNYTDKGFDAGMQERLAALCDRLTERGVAWVLSNADVPLAHTLYGRQPGAIVHSVRARRSINSDGAGRGQVGEIIAVCPSSSAI